MSELTTEQLELQELETIRENLKRDVRLGRGLEKLKKMPEFIELFDEMFLETGKDILWTNLRTLTEGEMEGRGSDGNLEMIEKLKRQVQSRLDYEAFIGMVESDYENAKEELEEMERA